MAEELVFKVPCYTFHCPVSDEIRGVSFMGITVGEDAPCPTAPCPTVDMGTIEVEVLQVREAVRRREELRIQIATMVAKSRFCRRRLRVLKRQWRSAPDAARTRIEWRQSASQSEKDLVRNRARHFHLAAGFLRHVPYGRMEATSHLEPNWSEVDANVKRYGSMFSEGENMRFQRWLEEARLHWRKQHERPLQQPES
jgi:hypothetical protein